MLYKNAFVKIRKSLGRYISLMAIVMIGVGFYAGVYATSPAITGVADRYFKAYRLMDFKINGALGLTDGDALALSALDGVVDAVPSYSLDLHSGDGVIRVHAVEETVNTVKTVAGRMPESSGECLADCAKYALGDTVEITDDTAGTLKNAEFTVVGLVESVLYLSGDYGSTTAGNGSLDSFIFVPRENFTLDAYTEIYVIADTGDATAYSSDYKNSAKETQARLTAIKPEREQARYDEIAELAALIPGGGESVLAGLAYPKWYITGRSAAAGYDVLESSIQVVTVVSSVLPLFFIVIAMLMTSNSMARMIAEERSELGTMTSLGYSDASITLTYIAYVLSAAWLGAAAGFFIGCRFIPPLIYSNFSDRLPPLDMTYNVGGLALILAVTSVLMSVVTVFACRRALRQKPASLMRPLPPRRGRRILLERIGFIWRRLSFTWKVTVRNMLRYKKRAFMTITGISGCTALLVTGFGLRDGMGGVAARQYGEIFRYDVMLVLQEETTSVDGELAELLEREKITEPLLISHSAFRIEKNGEALDCYVIVPQDTALFEQYFSLNTQRNKKLSIDNITVTQRAARVLDIKNGETLTISDTDNNSRTVEISGVAENYTSNYIFMSRDIYKEVFGEQPVYNAIIAGYDGDEGQLYERLSDSGLIAVFTSDAAESVYDSTQKLDGVIVLIMVVAVLLAVVVLYNLTAINISERTREIATLKVLGFRDSETNAYIYREAIVLILLGIAVGIFLGIALHRYISEVIEESVLSLTLKIKPVSFMLSGLIMAAVSGVMQLITYFKLKKLDMLKSLKSVE